MQLPMEIVVGSNYVKYDKLSQLIYSTYTGSNAVNLNIFVDLYSILKPLFSSDMNINYIMRSDVELSADIINMCAHYRSFFNNIGVTTRFYLIFGLNTPTENQILYPGYNEKFINAYSSKTKIRENVQMNLNLLDVLCPSLPGIYFFNIEDKEVSGFIEYIMRIYHLNNKELYPDTENIIITKDVLPLQLVSSGCNILRPKKSQGIDNSYIIDHNNFWSSFIVEMRNRMTNTIIQPIDVGYFSNILAMTKVPERCMSSLRSVRSAYSIFAKGIELGYLNPTQQDYSQSTINKVLEILGVNTNYTTLDMRWKAISSKFAAQYVLPYNPKLSNVQFKDIQDPDAVRQIVSTYYYKSPIDLDRL